MQPADRLHALDALRAFALLAGIALHATMPFLQGVPGWVTTEAPSETLAAVWYIIHMFRMPVFFLIAGFFGRMLLERRGTK
ncbi:MAG TPA: acyltransferase family protein, partial [Steroidobacteraceae bacterium]|nr:acyltransferase family protein [Steroidobacteraceae bacterium]